MGSELSGMEDSEFGNRLNQSAIRRRDKDPSEMRKTHTTIRFRCTECEREKRNEDIHSSDDEYEPERDVDIVEADSVKEDVKVATSKVVIDKNIRNEDEDISKEAIRVSKSLNRK